MRSFIAGLVGALAVLASGALLAISAAALLGTAATPGFPRSAMVAGLVVLALLLPEPDRDRWKLGALTGLGIGVVGVFGRELMTAEPSIGAGQIGVALGVVLVFPILAVVWNDRFNRRRLVSATLAILFIAVSIALIRTIIEGGALGHDESAYALKARSWLIGTPDTGWQLHRAPALSILGLPLIGFTEAEMPIRLIGAGLAVLALGGVALVGRQFGGAWSAVVAVATVGASLSFLRRGSEFLTDVAAAGILLVIVWLVLLIVGGPETNDHRVWWLGPLVAAAFYMRYQSALAVVGIIVGVLIVWPRIVAKLKRELGMAGGIAVLALIPHLVWATVVTGAPWGIVLFTQRAAGREFLGDGLVDYLRFFPSDLAGPAGAALMALGIGWLIWKGLTPQARDEADDMNVARFILIVVVIAVVPLGLVAHGEPRFVFFPVWLLIAVGSAFAVSLFRLVPLRYQPAAVVIVVLLWLPLFTETVRRVDRNAEARGDTFAVVADASNAIQADGPGTCATFPTYQPQVSWYSTCWTELFHPDDEDLGVGRLKGDREYTLLFENGKRQPEGDTLESYLALGPHKVIPAQNDRIGDAIVVSITPG